MEISGRLTADAQVRKTKDNRELVEFTLCVYWVSIEKQTAENQKLSTHGTKKKPNIVVEL